MAEAEPLFEHIDLTEDIAPSYFHGQAAEQKDGGIQKEDGRQQDGVPVADLFVGARIHVRARLARKKERDQDGKEHHVGGENGEDGKANLVQQLAWAAVLVLAIVVASATPTASGSPVNGRFAANSCLFPFRFRRGMRKGSGHSKPLWRSDYTTSPLGRGHSRDGRMAFFSNTPPYRMLCACLRRLRLHQINEMPCERADPG